MLKRIMGFMLIAGIFVSGSAAMALDQAVWNDLVSKTVAKGERGQVLDYTAFFLKKGTTFDRSKDRSVEYFTVYARVDLEGNVVPAQAGTVEEVWTRENNLWKVEQLIRGLRRDGRISDVVQAVLWIDDHNMVQKSHSQRLDIGAAQNVDAYEKKILEWSQF